eukprot:g3088.t1
MEDRERPCHSIIFDNPSRDTFRNAVAEYLFSEGLTNVIKVEVLRQIKFMFGSSMQIPKDLITVHMRWGDKHKETRLHKASKYVNAVKDMLLARSQASSENPVHVYVHSEDPRAMVAFREACPSAWLLYGNQAAVSSSSTASPQTGAGSTEGRLGTMSIAALVIAMEADEYVLTSTSNWSRLINELRLGVIDPRCNGCTRMIDLDPCGEGYDIFCCKTNKSCN